MPFDSCLNFRRVNDQLTTSGAVTAKQLGRLAESGYALLINLLPNDNRDAVPEEEAIATAQGVAYIHIPVDFRHPIPADYDAFSAALDGRDLQKTHIHCAANFRVSAFYALYAEERNEWTTAEADAFIQSVWNPQDYPPWAEFLATARSRFVAR